MRNFFVQEFSIFYFPFAAEKFLYRALFYRCKVFRCEVAKKNSPTVIGGGNCFENIFFGSRTSEDGFHYVRSCHSSFYLLLHVAVGVK